MEFPAEYKWKMMSDIERAKCCENIAETYPEDHPQRIKILEQAKMFRQKANRKLEGDKK